MNKKSLTKPQMETIIANLWGVLFDNQLAMRTMFDAMQEHGINMCEGEKSTIHAGLNCGALTIERIGIVMEQTGLRERIGKVANDHTIAKDEFEEEWGVRIKLRDSKHEPCQCNGLFDFGDYCDGCLRDLGLDEPADGDCR